MKVSLNWLGEFLGARASAPLDLDEARQGLTRVGFEVEAATPYARELSGLRVAEVIEVLPHPQADKLRLVRVRAGGEPVLVVCGAPNVPGPGGRVVWAAPGASLPGGMRIETRAVRGVDSPGMLVSERELGLSEAGEGILVLGRQDRVAPGDDLCQGLGLADWVLEVNVTPNRGDALSHAGLARELAATLGRRFVWPETPSVACTDEGPRRDVVIADAALCPRYQGRLVYNVQVGPSPLALRARLQACGVRAVSNLVDVTNFVLLEMGHPMHAFDDRSLRGRVQVRAAQPGERLRTLDGVERVLAPDDIVIADDEGPVALGGVMGGARTEIGPATRDVFLECATFDPVRVRRTSKRLGLASESSYRFERGVDAEGIPRAAARAAALLAWLGGGAVSDGMVDRYPGRREPRRVRLPLPRLRRMTGLPEVTLDDARARLEPLFGADALAGSESDTVVLEVPSFRPDLLGPEDLVEEFLRLDGFAGVPATPVGANARSLPAVEVPADWVRDRLAALGLCEAVTWGFVARAHIEALVLASPQGAREAPSGGAGQGLRDAIVVRNPISADYEVMRTSLLPGLAQAAARNLARGNDSPWLFEVGPVVRARRGVAGEGESPADERLALGVLLCGRRGGWLRPGDELDFFDLKNVAEQVVGLFAPGTLECVAGDAPGFLHPGVSAVLRYGAVRLGAAGELHPVVHRRLDLPRGERAFYLELELEPLFALRAAVRATAPPRFPAVTRDVSFFVAVDVPAAAQAAALQAAAEPLLVDVTVLEDFRDATRVPVGKKGMLWSLTYRAPDRTLTDAEVEAAHSRVLAGLQSALSIELR